MYLIVAVDENWVIGAKGDLLVRISDDMKFFKSKTMGKTVIMGRTTYESLPGKKPLPGRRNIVLTRDKGFRAEGFEVCHSFEAVFRITEKLPAEEVFIIGGEQIYSFFLPYCHGAFVTKIHAAFAAEKFLPNLDENEHWKLHSEGEVQSCQGHEFCFVEYVNEKPKTKKPRR